MQLQLRAGRAVVPAPERAPVAVPGALRPLAAAAEEQAVPAQPGRAEQVRTAAPDQPLGVRVRVVADQTVVLQPPGATLAAITPLVHRGAKAHPAPAAEQAQPQALTRATEPMAEVAAEAETQVQLGMAVKTTRSAVAPSGPV